MATTSKINIEVKIGDIEKLRKTAEKCFAVAKAHPYAVDISIRMDETNLLCKLQRILHYLQRQLLHHLKNRSAVPGGLCFGGRIGWAAVNITSKKGAAHGERKH